ncbi:hypothetical protein, partial [Dyella jejuensis]
MSHNPQRGPPELCQSRQRLTAHFLATGVYQNCLVIAFRVVKKRRPEANAAQLSLSGIFAFDGVSSFAHANSARITPLRTP